MFRDMPIIANFKRLAQVTGNLSISIYIGRPEDADYASYASTVEQQVLAMYPDATITINPTQEEDVDTVRATRDGVDDFEVTNAVIVIIDEVYTSIYGGSGY